MSSARYEILEELARGGSATVYRALDHESGRLVALKVMEGDPRDEQLVERFFRQASVLARLAGVDGVAKVRDQDFLSDCALAGRPYLTFDFHPQTLAETAGAYQGRAAAAARLVRDVASTVAEAHARDVSHGDLKPANVLLRREDGRDVPVLTDFGAARHTNQAPGTTTLGGDIGTWAYMAREQALELEGYDRKRADVYGLGAILYELLVGQAPYTGTVHDVRRGVLSMRLVPSPRSRGVEIAGDLELICLCCLEKVPSLRYGSAGELVSELAAFLEGRRPRIAQLGWFTRLARQSVRNPLGTVLPGLAVVLMLAAALVGVWTAAGLDTTLRDQIISVNAYAAKAKAGQVLLLLRGFGDKLRPCSKHPVITRYLLDQRGWGDAALNDALDGCAPKSTFDSVLLLDLEGRPLARRPDPGEAYRQKTFDFRDYYIGAKRLAARRLEWQRQAPEKRTPEPEDVWIARAHQSEGDHQFKFSLGMPVFDAPLGDPGAKCIGYLMATLGTDSTIASYPLSDPNDPRRVGSLVALRDRERIERDQPLPGEFRVLIHDGLRHGEAKPIDVPALVHFAAAIAAENPDGRHQFEILKDRDVATSIDHRDPIRGYWGRWLAGFARVGQTDQVVIVETRYDAVTIVEEYVWRVLEWAGVLLAVAFAAIAVAIVGSRRRAWV